VLVLRRLPRGCAGIALAGAATALPLVYYALLARADPQWSLSGLRISFAIGAMWWPLLAALAPLLLVGLPALRRPRQVSEQILLLWPLAVLAVYVVLGADSRLTALEGVSLPLSILAVRDWRRISVRPAAGIAAVVLAIVPGIVYSAATEHDELGDRSAPYALSRGEQDALDVLGHARGRVLTTPYLAFALPGLTGRMSVIDPLVGQLTWTPARLDALFDGRAAKTQAQALIEQSEITIVISDCLPGRADLTGTLRPLGFQKRRYGCAAVYRRTARYAPPPATG